MSAASRQERELNSDREPETVVTIHGAFPTDREPSALTRIRRVLRRSCLRLWGRFLLRRPCLPAKMAAYMQA